MKFCLFIILSVYTDRNIRSVVTNEIMDEMFKIKKKAVRWCEGFLGWFLPTESPRDSKLQLHTVTWPIHCLKCRRNHRGFQNGSFVWWRALFTVRIVDRITDEIIPSVNPSTKVNISLLCRPSPPLFLLFLPHPNSPNCKQLALQKKKKTPSSQHNKSYFLKSCGHNIRVLISRRIFISFCK